MKMKVQVVCLECTSSITSKFAKKFCSLSCSAQYNNKLYKKRSKINQTCKRCACVYKPEGRSSRRLCLECATSTTSSKTIGDYRLKVSVAGKHPSWIHSHIRGLNRSKNRKLCSLPCQKCNYSIHVELCHIRPISDFLDTDLISVVNHPSNLFVLCRNCHWEFDNGLLTVDDIPCRKMEPKAGLEPTTTPVETESSIH